MSQNPDSNPSDPYTSVQIALAPAACGKANRRPLSRNRIFDPTHRHAGAYSGDEEKPLRQAAGVAQSPTRLTGRVVESIATGAEAAIVGRRFDNSFPSVYTVPPGRRRRSVRRPGKKTRTERTTHGREHRSSGHRRRRTAPDGRAGSRTGAGSPAYRASSQAAKPQTCRRAGANRQCCGSGAESGPMPPPRSASRCPTRTASK